MLMKCKQLYVHWISNNYKIYTLITKSKTKDKQDKQKTWLQLHFFYTKHNFLASIYTTLWNGTNYNLEVSGLQIKENTNNFCENKEDLEKPTINSTRTEFVDEQIITPNMMYFTNRRDV